MTRQIIPCPKIYCTIGSTVLNKEQSIAGATKMAWPGIPVLNILSAHKSISFRQSIIFIEF